MTPRADASLLAQIRTLRNQLNQSTRNSTEVYWARETVRALDALLEAGQAPETAPTPLTFNAFSVANRARCESPSGFKHALSSWTASDWMTAVVGEVGEAANIIKKLNRFRDGVPGNKESETALRDKLRKELGDVFVYLDLLCQSQGFAIDGAAVEVFNQKSKEIGYEVELLAAPTPDHPPAPQEPTMQVFAGLPDKDQPFAGLPEAQQPSNLPRDEIQTLHYQAVSAVKHRPCGRCTCVSEPRVSTDQQPKDIDPCR